MRLLVIGGTGFIGSFIVSELVRAGHGVAIFHRGSVANGLAPGVRGIVGDRRTLGNHADALRDFAPEIVIDVILSSGRQAHELMESFRGVARRIVALSSMDVYRACAVLHGLEPGPLEPVPLTEQSLLRAGTHTYPPARIRMLQQVFGWLDDEYDKIPVERAILGDPELAGTVLRLPMVYGPGDRLHRLHPILKRIDDGRPSVVFDEEMAQWRGPRGYVENVAVAIALAATSDRAAGGIYNVAEPEALSELAWAQQVAAAADWKGRFVVLPRGSAPTHLLPPGNLAQHWVADTSRIRRELGYAESVDRHEAILRTIAWERANPPATIDPTQFDYEAEDRAIAQAGVGKS